MQESNRNSEAAAKSMRLGGDKEERNGKEKMEGASTRLGGEEHMRGRNKGKEGREVWCILPQDHELHKNSLFYLSKFLFPYWFFFRGGSTDKEGKCSFAFPSDSHSGSGHTSHFAFFLDTQFGRHCPHSELVLLCPIPHPVSGQREGTEITGSIAVTDSLLFAFPNAGI